MCCFRWQERGDFESHGVCQTSSDRGCLRSLDGLGTATIVGLLAYDLVLETLSGDAESGVGTGDSRLSSDRAVIKPSPGSRRVDRSQLSRSHSYQVHKTRLPNEMRSLVARCPSIETGTATGNVHEKRSRYVKR